MSASNPFQFLIDYYFFEEHYYCTDTLFICTSCLSGQKYRVRKLEPNGFKVDLRVLHQGNAIWKTQEIVAGITSVLGIVTDCEDEWVEMDKKKQKKKKTNGR